MTCRFTSHYRTLSPNSALQLTPGPLRVPAAPERRRWATKKQTLRDAHGLEEYDNIILHQRRAISIMSMHRKTITLTEQQDGWVKSQITGGKFGNDSEYIRDLIRRDQESQERLAALRQALLDGEASGSTKSLNTAAIKKASRAKAKVVG